jgi:hypothetical protein
LLESQIEARDPDRHKGIHCIGIQAGEGVERDRDKLAAAGGEPVPGRQVGAWPCGEAIGAASAGSLTGKDQTERQHLLVVSPILHCTLALSGHRYTLSGDLYRLDGSRISRTAVDPLFSSRVHPFVCQTSLPREVSPDLTSILSVHIGHLLGIDRDDGANSRSVDRFPDDCGSAEDKITEVQSKPNT